MKKILYEDVNIKRTGDYIDKFLEQKKTLSTGHPLFFHIEFSINGTCNRRCFFCPRVDPHEYPNQNLQMSISLAKKMADELIELNYTFKNIMLM